MMKYTINNSRYRASNFGTRMCSRINNAEACSPLVFLSALELFAVYLFTLLLLLGICSTAHAAQHHEISDIYIEAEGNNKYEARIKAYEGGMQRALLMIADKMGLGSASIAQVPYNALKSTFSLAGAMNEVATEGSYSATVTYKYDLHSVNKLFLEYGNKQVQDKFYDYLIIPIFKQRKLLTIWDNRQDWVRRWSRLSEVLDQSRLFYPKATPLLAQEINPSNIFFLTYEDFLEIFPGTLFKEVLLVISEYFTDSSSGNAMLDVQYVVLSHEQERSVTHDLYPISSMGDIPAVMNQAIITAIKKHSSITSEAERNLAVILEEKRNAPTLPKEEDGPRRIALGLDVFEEQELRLIESKLEQVPQIEKYEVKHENGSKYRVFITTRYSEFELAEGFYEVGLSFRVFGNLYKLIDIKEGL